MSIIDGDIGVNGPGGVLDGRDLPPGLEARISTSGHPLVYNAFNDFLAARAEVEQFIGIAQAYLDMFADADICHLNKRSCGQSGCQKCAEIAKAYVREEKIRYYFSPATLKRLVEPGVVYLVALADSPLYKIGSTRQWTARIKQLPKQLGCPVQAVHTIATNDHYYLERQWHLKFLDWHEKNELFALESEQIADFCAQSYMGVQR